MGTLRLDYIDQVYSCEWNNNIIIDHFQDQESIQGWTVPGGPGPGPMWPARPDPGPRPTLARSGRVGHARDLLSVGSDPDF